MSLLYETLRILLREPIIILMLGEWRSGKTDTSLLLAYLALKWKLIDKIGSNIYTFNNPIVEYIVNVGKLKTWLHADRTIKLFIFDEALTHIYRRKAMSKKNVDIVTEILPEMSKGHGRMLVCSQTEKIDTDVLDPVFTRAVFRKKKKTVMECVSKHFVGVRTFRDLPPSPIRFDPDVLAPFNMKEAKLTEKEGMGITYEVASMYSRGMSITKIKTEKNLHQEQIKREIRKALKWFVERYEGEGKEKEAPAQN